MNELTYLLESGSDRIGALDFQHSASEYGPRIAFQASNQELLEAADRVEKGLPLTLTPAYDICPQRRTGNESTQAMLIKGENRMSTPATCLSASADFHLSEDQATALIEGQIDTIAQNWASLCDEGALSPVDAKLFAGRQFLNPYCAQGLGAQHNALTDHFEDARARIIDLSEYDG